jgi:hypothetical protein
VRTFAGSALAVHVLEVVAPPVDVDEHPRDGRAGGARLVKITVEIAREGVRVAIAISNHGSA